MPRPGVDEYTLLCERCGYVIEGLPDGGNCPECGEPIAESLPAARAGSPWQREPGEAAWLRTAWRTLTHPRRTAAELRVQPDVRFGLFAHHVLAAAVLAGLAVAGGTTRVEELLHGRPIRGTGESAAAVFGTALLGFVVVMLLAGVAFHALSRVEERGIRFFSKRRGGRVTRTIARVVIAHAAVGWPVAVIGAIVGGLAAEFLLLATRCEPGPLRTAIVQLPWVLALPGFFVFEWFAYVGMRSMKFANRERPGAPAS